MLHSLLPSQVLVSALLLATWVTCSPQAGAIANYAWSPCINGSFTLTQCPSDGSWCCGFMLPDQCCKKSPRHRMTIQFGPPPVLPTSAPSNFIVSSDSQTPLISPTPSIYSTNSTNQTDSTSTYSASLIETTCLTYSTSSINLASTGLTRPTYSESSTNRVYSPSTSTLKNPVLLTGSDSVSTAPPDPNNTDSASDNKDNTTPATTQTGKPKWFGVTVGIGSAVAGAALIIAAVTACLRLRRQQKFGG